MAVSIANKNYGYASGFPVEYAISDANAVAGGRYTDSIVRIALNGGSKNDALVGSGCEDACRRVVPGGAESSLAR